MIATTASDSTPPVEYQFNETTGNSGGTDSGWQTSATYSDEGLSENTQYGYEVRARDSNGTINTGNYSTPISYEYTSIDPPTDVEVASTNGTSWINATVTQPLNPTSDWTASNFSWTTGGANYSDWQNGTYYHNRTGLSENTEYGFQVQFRNGDGDAGSFNPTEETNYTQCNPPTDAEFTFDTKGRTWINMSVLDVDNNPTSGYTAAYFECVTGGASDSGWVTDISGGRYYYNSTGLSSSTTYGFRVKYRNAETVETSYTSENQTSTNAPIAPTVYTNASSQLNETNATLNGWLQDNGDGDTICYFLLNDTNDFGSPIFNLSKGIIADGAEFENNTAGETTLTQGKLYYFKAQANNSGGWVDGSVEIFLTKPENISAFTATLYGTTQINLTWTDETGGDGAYIEYAKNSPPSPWNEGDGTPVDADGNVTSPFAHASLDPGTTYYYKAWAYATDGTWTSSGNQTAPRGSAMTASATTTGSPTVYTNDTTGIGSTNATLEGWLQSNGTLDTYCYFLLNDTKDFGSPIFNLSKGIIVNGDGFENDTAGETTLTKGMLYYVDTKANNSGGWDESGGIKAFLTKPDPPSNLVAQMNSSSIIYLTWSTGTGFNTTYIERNTVTSWLRGSGTEIYNDSGTNFEDGRLTEGITYYYQAWSFANWTYNPTLHQWSDNNASSSNTTEAINTSIEITPGIWDIGSTTIGNYNYSTSGFYFNLTNEGNVVLNIQIKGSNATNSTTEANWTLTSIPGHDNYSLQYNKSSNWNNINLTYDTFVTSFGVGAWQTFDLNVFMALTSTKSDPLSITVTFRSVIS
jgi:hypothetical protein